MTSTAIGSAATSSATPQQLPSTKSLTTSDFLNMMITQLQNQDPLQPTSSQDLLTQISQIGQLQSATDLQTAIQGLVLQGQIASASSLIGKSVEGLDDQNNTIRGVVNSINVQGNNISLELDNGQTLTMAKITSIAPGPSAMPAASTSVQAAAA